MSKGITVFSPRYHIITLNYQASYMERCEKLKAGNASCKLQTANMISSTNVNKWLTQPYWVVKDSISEAPRLRLIEQETERVKGSEDAHPAVRRAASKQMWDAAHHLLLALYSRCAPHQRYDVTHYIYSSTLWSIVIFTSTHFIGHRANFALTLTCFWRL